MNYISQTRRRLQPEPHELALRELEDDPEAVALARIVQVATPLVDMKTQRPFALYDCRALANDRLDDLIFETCNRHGCERSELVSTGELIDLLGNAS